MFAFYFELAAESPFSMLGETLKIHKIEIFFGFDFEICIISLLVMSKLDQAITGGDTFFRLV
jgi:hypothetical protein